MSSVEPSPTRRNRRLRIRPMRQLLFGLIALSLVATACSGGEATPGDEAAENVATPQPTIELFAIPSPTAVEEDDNSETVDSSDDPASPEGGDDADPDEDGSDPQEVDGSDPVSDTPIVWTHVEDFDLVFENGRTLLTPAVDTFYDVGGGDISESVDTILASIDHPLGWQDAADVAVATFPEGLGEASGVFALLSTQWAVIGCESHLAGMSQPSWTKLLFDHLVAEASNLPPEQADNQAGVLLAGSNAAISALCPRLVPS